MKNLIALGFLIFAVVIMATIMQGVVKLTRFKWQKDGKDGVRIIKMFQIPLLSITLFIVYVMFIVPYLDSL